jgi:hypothetical protein
MLLLTTKDMGSTQIFYGITWLIVNTTDQTVVACQMFPNPIDQHVLRMAHLWWLDQL